MPLAAGRASRARGRRPIGHGLGLVVGLSALWLLLSGHYEPLILFFALVSVTLTAYIALRMDVVDHEAVPLHLSWRILPYWLWLGLEIVKANIDVAWRVLHPRLPISPQLFEVAVSQRSDLGQVIYANSITLTPGTVSVDLGAGSIRVHALTAEGAQGVEEAIMDRKVTRLDGD